MHRYFRLVTKAVRLLVVISILSSSAPTSLNAATASRDRRAFSVPEPSVEETLPLSIEDTSETSDPILQVSDPITLTLRAVPRHLPADGTSETTVWVRARDENGDPVPDGTLLTASTTLGQLARRRARTQDGIARFTLVAAQEAGRAIVVVRTGDAARRVAVRFVTPRRLGTRLGDVSQDPPFDPDEAAEAARHPMTLDAEGVATAEGESYTMRFDGERMAFALNESGGAGEIELGFSLLRVLVGGQVLFERPATPPAVRVRENRAIVRRLPTLREVYVALDEGVKQNFVLREPLGSGDENLVFVGEFDTSPANLTPSYYSSRDGIVFEDEEGNEVLAYTGVIVRDALGQEIVARLRLNGQRVRIVVPGEWLAQAEYPVVVDPMIGDLIVISSGANWSGKSAVAYNSDDDEWLVVWQDNRNGGDHDVYGQRVQPDGTLSGSNFAIVTVSDLQQYPDVAYNSATGQYLVVWQDYRNTSWDIYGRRVTAGGVVTGTEITICVTSATQVLPAVTYQTATEEWLVVWNGGQTQGQRVSADGTLVGSNFSISQNNIKYRPDVTANPEDGEYLVVWGRKEAPGEYRVRARRVLTDGTLLGSELVLSPAGGVAGWPRVAHDGNDDEYLVVWQDYRNTNWDIYGQRVTDAGVLTGSNLAISSATGDEELPSITWDERSERYLVGWEGYGLGQRVWADGTLDGGVLDASAAVEWPDHAYGQVSGIILGAGGIYGNVYAQRYAIPAADFSATPLSGTAPLTVTFSNLSQPLYGTTGYTWTFGDGATSTLTEPVHTYTTTGAYTVTLTVAVMTETHTLTRTNYITVTSGSCTTPTASFSASPLSGTVPLTVTFSDASGGTITGRSWDLGDGTTSTATNPTHTYTQTGPATAGGAYTVSLTVNGPCGSDTLTRTNYITVAEAAQPPVAGFTAAPTEGDAPLTVIFTNTTTGEVTGYEWTFGDGATSALEHPTHTYTVTGAFTVSLTATGPGGSDALTRTNYITVTEATPPPVAGFTAAPTEGDAPLTVTFTNTTTGEVTGYLWDFGDDTTSTLVSPTHVYTSVGVYTVVLTATGPGGSDTLTRTNYVNVTQATPPPVAGFTAAPLSGEAPFQVVFTNTTTGEVTGYRWDFGDGGISIQEHPIHAYVTGGTYAVALVATGPGGSDTLTRTNYVTVIQVDYNPVVTITTPVEGAVVGSGDVQVTGLVSDDGTVTGVWVNDVSATLDGATFSATVPLTAGNQVVYAVAQDDLGQAGFASRVVRVDGEGPMVAIHTPRDRQAVYSLYPTATISYTDFYTGVDTATFSATLTEEGGTVTDVSGNFSVGSTGASGTLGGPLDEDATYTLTVSIADAYGYVGSDSNTFYVPSDPGDVTPPAAPEGTGWVSGVVYDSGTCNEHLSTCQGLPGVHVTVASINHETRVVTGDMTGTIVTGPDGFYAFPVDETGTFALRFEKEGYTYGQREVAVVRARSTAVNAIYLTPLDTITTVVSYPITQTVVHTNSDGSMVLEIPPSALAPGQAVTVTATNYEHVEFLPSGDLPPGTWETYAFNLGGDSEITFTHPITVRLQNSRDFDPGTKIPLGYWNQATLQWEHVGVGTVDDTGDWLVMHVDHFSNYDCNDPVTLPGIGGGPGDESCEDGDCPAGEEGCFINLKSGQMREQIDLPTVNVLGEPTAPTIAYDTNRANPSEVIDVRLDLNFDPQLVEIGDYVQFELYIEGQKTDNFTFQASIDGNGEVGRYRYLWDGRNALGEQLPPGVYAYAVKLSVPYAGQYYYALNGRFGGPPDLSAPTGVFTDVTRDFWTYGTVALNAQPDSALGSGWVLKEQQQLTEDEAGRIVVSEGSELTEYYFELTDQLDGLTQYDLAEPPVIGPAAEIVIPPPPETGTEVSGTITANVTWTQDSSPYLVTGDVVVTDGVTLTIQPGVTVMLDQYQRLVAEGELQAVGTPTTPITFTAYTDGSYEDWLTYTIPSDANTVGAVTVDKDGNVWFASGYDVDRFDPDLETWDSYDLCYNYDLLPGWCSDGINDLATDDLGQVWIATNNGAAVLSVTNGVSLTVYQNEEDSGPRSNTVSAVAVEDDITGTIWFGAGNYASSFDPDTGDWEAYSLGYCELYDGVRSLAVDVLGHVWMGAGDGLCRVKPDEVGQEDADPWDTYYEGDSITDIAFDHQGNVWMAVYDEEDGEGIRVLTGTAWMTYTGWITYTAGSDELVSDDVTSIAVDSSNRKWIGYEEDGISFLSADNQVWFHETKPRLGDDQVGDVAVSPDGSVWIGTYACEDVGEGGMECTGRHATHVAQVVYLDGTISGGYWGYVQIGGGSNLDDSDGSRLSHVVVESAGVANTQGLYLYQSAPALDNLTIRGSGGDGLYAQGSTGFTLDTATIEGNEGSGVRIEGVTAGHVLTNVTSHYNSGHGLYLEYEEGDGEDILVTGTILAHNFGYGVYVQDDSGDAGLILRDSTVEQNEVAARLMANALSENNVWADNGRNQIEWTGGTVTGTRTWNDDVDAYVVLGGVTVADGVTLTIAAGSRVLFDDCGLDVNGTLSATGTAEETIYFEPVNDQDGWSGLDINGQGGDNGTSHLRYAIIRGASIGLFLEQIDQNTPTLDHLSLVENGYGLYVYEGDAVVAIHNSVFVANDYYGLYNYGGEQVDATYNFWNATNGPSPSGGGDEVYGNILFDPWLSKPPLIAGMNYVLANRTATDHTTLAYDADTDTYTRYYPDGREVHFGEDGTHDYTLEPDGRKTTYTYNSDGTVEAIGIYVPDNGEDPAWVWEFDYDENDKLMGITDPAGRETEFFVDANGHLTQTILPDGSSRQFIYDQRNLMTQQVDQGGHVTSYAYDDYGRLIEHVDPLRDVYTLTVLSAGDPTTGQITQTQEVRAFTPSDTGYALINDSPTGTPDNPAQAVPTSTQLVDGVTYGRGGRTGHTNVWGRFLDETDGLGRTTTYDYDEDNNITGLVWPEGNRMEAEYDDAGNPVSVIRGGSGETQEIVLTYEPRFNHLKTQTDPLGNTTTYYYDYELDLGEAGELVRVEYPPVQDENGITVTPVVSYTYNDWGLLETETDARGTVTCYEYTQDTPMPGLLMAVIRDCGGLELTTTYGDFDALGNAQAVTATNGTVTRYRYDEMGRVVSQTNTLGITTLSEYDGQGNLVRQVADYTPDGTTGRNVVTEYEYDADGRSVGRRTETDGQVVQTSSAYDVNGELAYQEDTRGNASVSVYDDADQLVSRTDPSGNVTAYTYDLNGRQETVTDTRGIVTRKEYDDYGYVVRSVTNWDDGVFDLAEPEKDVETRYEYDLAGNTIVVSDTLGHATRTWYDARNRTLGTIANWDGETTLADCAGLSPMRDENICTLYAYDIAGSTVIVTDTLGRMTRTFYDALGRVEARVANWNPATLASSNACVLSPTNESEENVCTLYGYDAAGNQITTTNALDQTSLTVYDETNRPIIHVANWDGTTSITSEADCSFPPAVPDTNLCTVTYYERDQRSGTKDPLGHLTEFGYDAHGRLVTTTRTLDGVPVVTVNHYDALGNRVGQTDARGNTTTYVYDHLGRLETSISAEGVANTQGYDEYGRVVTSTDGLGNETITGYDVLGRRATVTDAEGNVTRYEYGALGNQAAITDANNVRTGYLYDELNRLVGVIENDTGGVSTNENNVLTRYLYDALGNLVVITNARNYTSTYTIYDDLNRAVIVRDALGHETHTRYDALGRRTVVTDADDGVTYYGYDGLNRLISVEYPEFTVQYAYNAAGNRTVMTDSVGVTHYVYDDLYRLVSVDDPITGTVGYGYDLAGNRTQLTYPTGEVVTYTYNADNRLIEVEDWDGGLTTYEYDAAGRLTATELPNGVVTVNEYDDAGRLVNLTHTAADETLLSSYEYELNGVGNRVRVTETLTETTRVITYTYDFLNRLTEADHSTGERYEYAYDEVGNRTAMTTTADVTLYEYDNANRLTSVDGVTYTWDDRGNLVGNGTFTYTYNTAGRMVQAESITVTVVYTYNANGLRVAQSVDGTVTTFVWDWASGLPEMLSDGDNLYLISYDTLGYWDGSEWAYYLPDALGSIRQATDEAGSVTNSREWTPFGTEVGTAQPGLGYTGEWWDDNTESLYLRARWYNGEVGRFTSRDPWEGILEQPNTLLRSYAYVGNNPINGTDPTGLQGDVGIITFGEWCWQNPAQCAAVGGAAAEATLKIGTVIIVGGTTLVVVCVVGTVVFLLLVSPAPAPPTYPPVPRPEPPKPSGNGNGNGNGRTGSPHTEPIPRLEPQPQPRPMPRSCPDPIYPPIPTPTPTPTPEPPNEVVVRFVKKSHYDLLKEGILKVWRFQTYATTLEYLISMEIANPGFLQDESAIAEGLLGSSHETIVPRVEYFVAFYRRGLDEMPYVDIMRDDFQEIKWQFIRVPGFDDPDFVNISGFKIDTGKTSEKMSMEYLLWLRTLE